MNAPLPRLSDFPGGLKLDEQKQLVADGITVAPVPPRLVVPLAQHVGAPADPCVAVGDRVRRGEVIGRAHGYVSLPVHAPSSGTVVAIEERPVAHPSRLPARCIVIDTDGADEPAPPQWTPRPDYAEAEAHELREIARAAGISGLGGASFPTAVKLNPGRPVDTLIINGAECEPYIACDQALMAEAADEIVAGIRIMLHALDTQRCTIGIEDNKTAAIAALREAATGDERISVVVVPSRYPQGGEKQLIQTLTGLEVPSQGLPLDIGIVCHNPGTVRAVYRAVVHGEALIDRVVSLTGHAMAAPRNVRARLGTPLGWLVEQYGGYAEPPGRLVMGGPMMGIELPHDDIPVVKATNCLLAMTRAEIQPKQPAMACIRCGACADVCPAKLLPQQLYWHARAREFDKTQDYNLFDCIECGCCAAVCPSHIPLVQYYRFAKTEIWAEERERRAADAARVRYEERQQRLEREEAEKKAAREARKAKLKQETRPAEPRAAQTDSAAAPDDPVARALAKAKAAKAAPPADTGKDPKAAAASQDDPVAQAMARAKAAKAAKASDTPRTEPTAPDDPVAQALARAKAAKAAKAAEPTEHPAEAQDDDPVARALAKAKAAKAARQQSTDTPAPGDSSAPEAEPEDPVARALAKARAAKAAKQDGQQGQEGTAAPDAPKPDRGQ